MRIYELAKRKKIEVPYDPIEDARASLEWYKEHGLTIIPNGTLQLFVPRNIKRYATRKEREDYVLRDRAKYAYDDEGNMIPQFRDWVNSANESYLPEGAPIIAGGWLPKIGGDKPLDALLWTSTAKKFSNGKWTSDWNKFVQGNNVGGEPGKIGYLYKVRPNTTMLELDSINDAKQIYKIFSALGRPNKALDDQKNWDRADELQYYGRDAEAKIIRQDFPWDQIAKHFDCVHHWPMRGYYGERDPFFGGWDVESTVWFKPNQLEFLGQVPLETSYREEEDD